MIVGSSTYLIGLADAGSDPEHETLYMKLFHGCVADLGY